MSEVTGTITQIEWGGKIYNIGGGGDVDLTQFEQDLLEKVNFNPTITIQNVTEKLEVNTTALFNAMKSGNQKLSSVAVSVSGTTKSATSESWYLNDSEVQGGIESVKTIPYSYSNAQTIRCIKTWTNPVNKSASNQKTFRAYLPILIVHHESTAADITAFEDGFESFLFGDGTATFTNVETDDTFTRIKRCYTDTKWGSETFSQAGAYFIIYPRVFKTKATVRTLGVKVEGVEEGTLTYDNQTWNYVRIVSNDAPGMQNFSVELG